MKIQYIQNNLKNLKHEKNSIMFQIYKTNVFLKMYHEITISK